MDAQTFLAVAGRAERLIASDRVAERWERPSALDGYRAGALAGHLARAVLAVASYLNDLAVNVGLDGPEHVPVEGYEVTEAVLARVAGRRVGHLATIRCLAQRERHPDAVRALGPLTRGGEGRPRRSRRGRPRPRWP